MDKYDELLAEIDNLKAWVDVLKHDNQALRSENERLRRSAGEPVHDQDVNGIPCHEGTLCFNRECARLGCLLDREQR